MPAIAPSEKAAAASKAVFTLTPQQQAVIDWAVKGDGNLNLIARAGTGKTFTIERMVEALCGSGHSNIFVGAYNKPIAQEVKAKLAKWSWKQVQASTFHSIGLRNWRKVAPKVELDPKKIWKIIDALVPDIEAEQFASYIRAAVAMAKEQAFGVLQDIDDEDAWREMGRRFDFDDKLADAGDPGVGQYDLDQSRERAIAWCIKVYRESLAQDKRVIDYADMILAPLIHNARLWRFDWVIVDEAQDINPARRALAFALLKRNGRFVAVGDDMQAIYGFTGADSDALDIIRAAKSSETLSLTVTHRCPKAVVDVAREWVPDYTAHEDAPEGIVREIEDVELIQDQPQPADAILCRNTKPLIKWAYKFLQADVPCRVEGREIGEGLKSLAKRWKLTRLTALVNKLRRYRDTQTQKLQAKGEDQKAQNLDDQVSSLLFIIHRVRMRGGSTIADLERHIDELFSDYHENPDRILTLATIHRSKGREWNRVYWLGRDLYQPSKYARKGWEIQQEKNLLYVAATRAKQELVDVVVTEDQRKDQDEYEEEG